MTMVPILETERLRLRGHRPSDKEAIIAAYADPGFARFITVQQRALSREEAWRAAVTPPGSWALNGFGMWLVEDKASGEPAGVVGPWQPEGWPDLEIGWQIFPPHMRKGLATEAAAAAFAWVRATFGRDHVIHLIDPANSASQGVARRLGSAPSGACHRFATGLTCDIWRTCWTDFVETEAGRPHVATRVPSA